MEFTFACQVLTGCIALGCIACWVIVLVNAFTQETNPLLGVLCLIPCFALSGFIVGWIYNEKWKINGVMTAWTMLLVIGLALNVFMFVLLGPVPDAIANGNGSANTGEMAFKIPKPMARNLIREVEDVEGLQQTEQEEEKPKPNFFDQQLEKQKEDAANGTQKRLGFRGFGRGGANDTESSESDAADATKAIPDNVKTFSRPIAGPLFKHEKLETPIAAVVYRDKHVRRSAYLGYPKNGSIFTEKAPDGGLLVGFYLAVASEGGKATINGIQSIYLVGDEYSTGEFYVAATGELVKLEADPGYVVNGMVVNRESTKIRSIQLQYARMNPSLKIDVNDVKFSKTAGKVMGNEATVTSATSQIVGISGRASDKLYGMCLWAVKGKPGKLPEKDPTREFRIWKSAKGNYEFEARLESRDKGEVVLVSRDGAERTVKLEQLCQDDRDWVDEHFKKIADLKLTIQI